MPTPKPPSFPLLRLPAELRALIWEHLYGRETIHVSLKSYNKPAEASHKDLEYTIRRKSSYPHHQAAFSLPPRVSRQIYTEAIAAIYATSTFSFDSPHVFRAFALSNHACVPHIQHLTISRLTHHWTEALVSSLVGRLTGLRGVCLTHQYWHCSEARPLPHAADATWRDYWRMIRSFQQHKLEAQRTRFELEVTNVIRNSDSPYDIGSWKREKMVRGMAQYGSMMNLQTAFTEGLMDFKPRRLSRRSVRNG